MQELRAWKFRRLFVLFLSCSPAPFQVLLSTCHQLIVIRKCTDCIIPPSFQQNQIRETPEHHPRRFRISSLSHLNTFCTILQNYINLIIPPLLAACSSFVIFSPTSIYDWVQVFNSAFSVAILFLQPFLIWSNSDKLISGFMHSFCSTIFINPLNRVKSPDNILYAWKVNKPYECQKLQSGFNLVFVSFDIIKKVVWFVWFVVFAIFDICQKSGMEKIKDNGI